MGAILSSCQRKALSALAGLVVAGVLARQTHAAEPGCAAADLGARAAAIADPRSIVLEDGRGLRLARIETFSLLLPEGAETQTALQRPPETLRGCRPLRARPA